MKLEALPRVKPLGTQGDTLRRILAHAVSECEKDAIRRGGTSPKATQLDTLAAAVRTALASLRDLTAPTLSTITQAVGSNTIVLTYNGGLEGDYVPPTTAFAITSPARTVTGVAVNGARVEVTYSGVSLVSGDTPLIAYTQDTSAGHRDEAGNLAATFAASAVTVA